MDYKLSKQSIRYKKYVRNMAAYVYRRKNLLY